MRFKCGFSMQITDNAYTNFVTTMKPLNNCGIFPVRVACLLVSDLVMHLCLQLLFASGTCPPSRNIEATTEKTLLLFKHNFAVHYVVQHFLSFLHHKLPLSPLSTEMIIEMTFLSFQRQHNQNQSSELGAKVAALLCNVVL